MRMSKLVALMLAGASTVSTATAAFAQAQESLPATANSGNQAAAQPDQAGAAEIVVTGSRVITNGNAAPTPVTVVQTEQLTQTAPSSIPDALNRLPQFASQPSTRNIGNAQGNLAGNFLSLRNFGSNRNLVLLDGNRMPPTAANGAVDTNTIPQALIERVEIVTGGASAVYGSDAVTGVINFILDKDFTGLKASAQAGISDYGDGETWKVSIAGGTPIGDRGHFEASFDHYDAKGLIGIDVRPELKSLPTIGGQGTEDNPYRVIPNGRVLTGSAGGFILPTSGLPNALRDIAFDYAGNPVPFVHGADTGVNGLESGGSGGYYDASTYQAPVRTNQAFARFDYDLTDTLNFYVQGSYSDAFSEYPYASTRYTATVLSGNPFIPDSIQQIMTDNNVASIDIGRLQSVEDGIPPRVNSALTKNFYGMVGLTGSFLDNSFEWTVNYIHSVSKQDVTNRNNTNSRLFAGAVDAVIDPATGRVVCQPTLNPMYAAEFAGCEPLNVFGNTGPTKSAYEWFSGDTNFVLTNTTKDVNASVSGSLFDLWAGPVRMAVSGEYRWLTLDNDSSTEAAAQIDCSGLRANCTSRTPLWQHDVSSSMSAKQNVKEVAGELLIPLLQDFPLAQSLELNLAARYTDYSTSGGVTTWKVGGSWEVVDGFRIRATRSRDIRAPTLTDLFAPVSLRPTGYTDLHTNVTGALNLYSQGNANLVPEVANTTTIGVVVQPSFLPDFSLAVDYYSIRFANAIVSASGFSQIYQRECEDSNGLSPFCDLFERPLPFDDHTPANFPTRVFSQPINAAKQWTKGVDFEVNYRIRMEEMGDLAIRGLLAYQPIIKRQTVPSQDPTNSAGVAGSPKINANISVAYTLDRLNVAVNHRWQSSVEPTDRSLNVDARPDIPAYNYTDLSLSYRLDMGAATITPFFTVENLFNKRPPIIGTQNNVPGLFFPTARGSYDIMGRYFTLGVRARL